MVLEPVDKTTFKVTGNDAVSFTFQREGEKVAGMTFKTSANNLKLRRVEPGSAKLLMPKKEIVEDKVLPVTTPLNWPSFRGPHASGNGDA